MFTDGDGLGLPRHAGRHRLPHPHGQRPRRGRLGRGRHRGRGGHARPAHLDAHPRRWSASSCTASCPRAPPPPTWCSPSPSCCASTAWSASSSSSTGRAWPTCRSRTGPRSATCRPSTARRSPSSRSTTRRCATCGSPAGPTSLVALVEAYAKEQGLWHDPTGRARLLRARSSSTCRRSCRRSPARPAPGPRAARPAKGRFAVRALAPTARRQRPRRSRPGRAVDPPAIRRRTRPPGRRCADPSDGPDPPTWRHAVDGRWPTAATVALDHGHVVIAAITSCTNTSNPSVMLAAGLLAKKAVERGLRASRGSRPRWRPARRSSSTTTSGAGLTPYLEQLGFNLVGFGCTTCIGNSGPLPAEIAGAVDEGGLAVVVGAVGQPQLRGPHQPRRAHELPGVAAAGRGLRPGRDRWTSTCSPSRSAPTPTATPVFLRDIWPTTAEVDRRRRGARCASDMFRAGLRRGVRRRRAVAGPRRADRRPLRVGRRARPTCASRRTSTACTPSPAPRHRHRRRPGAGLLGDSVTTDHISPGRLHPGRQPGRARGCIEQAWPPADFNSYGARRGNHEVMIRGTFANIRLRNRLAPGTEGGVTLHLPDGEQMSIYDAADALPAPRACRWWCWPARSTARARRATGRPRARRCSACGR